MVAPAPEPGALFRWRAALDLDELRAARLTAAAEADAVARARLHTAEGAELRAVWRASCGAPSAASIARLRDAEDRGEVRAAWRAAMLDAVAALRGAVSD